MAWSLKLITPPATEPLLYTDLQAQSRIDSDAEDGYLTGLCMAVRSATEEHISRSLITQTWELGISQFPYADRILLPRGPIQTVNSVSYTDSTLTTYTLVANTDYLVDLARELGEVVVPFGRTWPTAVLSTAKAVTINFTAGYGDSAAAIPAAILIAMKQLAASWFDSRESYTVGRGLVAVELPASFEALLATYRLRYSGPC